MYATEMALFDFLPVEMRFSGIFEMNLSQYWNNACESPHKLYFTIFKISLFLNSDYWKWMQTTKKRCFEKCP